MPRVLTIVAALRRSSGRYLPRWVRNASRSFNCGGGDLLLETLGHQRLLRGGHLVDVFAEDDVPLPLGVEQLDGGLRLRREQPADHAAVGGGDRVLDEVALDATGSGRGCGSRARRGATAATPERSGPTWPPSPPWRWHLAHCCWKTSLPAAGSPPSSSWAVSRSITRWRSGSGRPPPCASSRLARAAIVAVGMGGQGLLLVERQLGEPDRVLLERVDQAPGSSRRGRARPGAPATARWATASARRSTNASPDLGRLAGGDGVDQAGGQLGRRAGA